MYDEMTVFEVAEALGHDVCETCREQVCTNPGHGGSCAYDGPGYQVEGLTFCKECGPAARMEDEPTDVQPIPLACDVEETTPIRHETAAELAQKMDRRGDGVPGPRPRERRQWLWAFLVVAVSVAGIFGCAPTHAPAAEVETVGTLVAGGSVYSAPLKHDAPPVLGFVAGSDDDVSSVATTVSRVDAGEADAAPEVEAKNSHGF